MSRRNTASRLLMSPLLYWGAVPLLAVVAYALVLSIGFVSDDFVLLYQGQASGIDPHIFVPQPHWYLYRPLGSMLVWQVGWQLWGFNPLPFHLQSLLLHSASSLLLGLWLAETTGKRALGWLAGVLFGVFPLHMEAVGWAAAGWDTLALFFGIASLYLFALWWRRARHAKLLYVGSVVLYAAAIFTKESLLIYLPMFALSAWLATSPARRLDWRRLLAGMLPLTIVLGSNLGLRLLSWGHLGGYGRTPTDLGTLLPAFWDRSLNYMHLLLSPLNAKIFGNMAVQVVGVMCSAGLLVGLAMFGRRYGRLLAVAGAWVALGLAPVLSIDIETSDLQNNRLVYVASAGYCIAVAALLYAALVHVQSKGWGRKVASGVIATLVVLCIAVCWAQLQPWRVASAAASQLEKRLVSQLPLPEQSDSASGRVVWYVENPPDNYKGAYISRLGLGITQYFNGRAKPVVVAVPDAAQALLTSDAPNSFAMRFVSDPDSPEIGIDYIAGVSSDTPTFRAALPGAKSQVWDFSSCDTSVLAAWRVDNALAHCEVGRGLALEPTNADPQLTNAILAAIPLSKASMALFRASVTYQEGYGGYPLKSQWFWADATGDFGEAKSIAMSARQDNRPHIYWSYVPAERLGSALSTIRYDPANFGVPLEVKWIAMDFIGAVAGGVGP